MEALAWKVVTGQLRPLPGPESELFCTPDSKAAWGIGWETAGRLGIEKAVELRSTAQPVAAVPG